MFFCDKLVSIFSVWVLTSLFRLKKHIDFIIIIIMKSMKKEVCADKYFIILIGRITQYGSELDNRPSLMVTLQDVVKVRIWQQ